MKTPRLKHKFLYLILIQSLIVIFISCGGDDDADIEPQNQNNTTDYASEVYTEMLSQGYLEESSKSQFDQNISDSAENLNLSKSYSYDSNLDITTTTISISSNIGFVTDVTMIEYIPKDIASSVNNMQFSTPPTEIVKQDPIIMWHFLGLGNNDLEISYSVNGNHVTTGSTYSLVNNNYSNCSFSTGFNFMPSWFRYSETYDLDKVFWNEWGTLEPQLVVADWNQLKNEFDLDRFAACMNLKNDDTFFIKRNGERFYNNGNRQYYIHYSEDGLPYPGFLAHDQIGNFYLGSWYGINMQVLLAKPNNNILLDPNGLTADINSFVPQSILDEMINLGMTINTGANPPVINNSYSVSPLEIIGTNIPGETAGAIFNDYNFKLYNQNNADLTVELDYKQEAATGNGQGAFIVGDNNKFSVFAEVIISWEGESAKVVQVLSGTLVNNGIENFKLANIMVDNNGNPTGLFIDEGQGRVARDSDGFSELINSLKSNEIKYHAEQSNYLGIRSKR